MSDLSKKIEAMTKGELRKYATKLAVAHLRSLDWEQFWGEEILHLLWRDDALAARATAVKREIEDRLEKVR